MKHARTLAVLLGMAVCQGAYAVRTSVSDESDVGEAGDCQAELVLERARVRGQPTQRERAVRLACGIGWNTELELAHARERSGADRSESLALEAKTALRDRGEHRVGWAVALAVGSERIDGAWRRSSHEASVEATRQLSPQWLVEAKLGAARDVLSRRNSTRWALASEHALTERFELRAEIGGDDRRQPLAQLGLRYTLWPEYVQLTASYGARSGSERERIASMGLQIEF
jgi:hypothetical protein